MRQQFLAGDRPAYDPDTGDELGPDGFAALDPGTQNQIAEDELGDTWDSMWLYPDGSEGLDPGPRRLFHTRQEAESAAQTARVAGTSLYEVVACYPDAMDFANAVAHASGLPTGDPSAPPTMTCTYCGSKSVDVIYEGVVVFEFDEHGLAHVAHGGVTGGIPREIRCACGDGWIGGGHLRQAGNVVADALDSAGLDYKDTITTYARQTPAANARS
jgi:hypothetical protein